MTTRRVKLSRNQEIAIKSKHGHPKGGLSLHDIKTGSKVQVTNPIFLQTHKGTIIAKGRHPDHGGRVAQIVHKGN